MKNKHLYFILAFCVIAYIITLKMFLCEFGSIIGNGSSEKWGHLGDFVGGILNPLFTIINIGVLIFLTYKISGLDNKRTKKTIQSEKIKLMTEMRQQAISELEKSLDNVFDTTSSDVAIRGKAITLISIAFKSFQYNNQTLFKDIFEKTDFKETNIKPLDDAIGEMFNIPDEQENNVDEQNNPKDSLQTYTRIMHSYIEKKSNFINNLRKYTIEELIK